LTLDYRCVGPLFSRSSTDSTAPACLESTHSDASSADTGCRVGYPDCRDIIIDVLSVFLSVLVSGVDTGVVILISLMLLILQYMLYKFTKHTCYEFSVESVCLDQLVNCQKKVRDDLGGQPRQPAAQRPIL